MNKLQVWWIPQVPGKPFIVSVSGLKEAKLILDTLAYYDIFQFENNIKGDYCNVGGLQVWDEMEGWLDWYDNGSGLTFDEYYEEFPELFS